MEGWAFVGDMILRRVPMLLLALVGIIVAIIRWNRHPKVSLLTIGALFLFVAERTIFIAANYRLVRFLSGPEISASSYQVVSAIVSVIDEVFFAIIIIMLVVAALTQRSKTPSLGSPT